MKEEAEAIAKHLPRYVRVNTLVTNLKDMKQVRMTDTMALPCR